MPSGDKRRAHRHWTKEDDRFIINNYGKMSDKEIGLKLGKSMDSIKVRRSTLKKKGVFIKKYKPSSTGEVEIVKDNLVLASKFSTTMLKILSEVVPRRTSNYKVLVDFKNATKKHFSGKKITEIELTYLTQMFENIKLFCDVKIKDEPR